MIWIIELWYEERFLIEREAFLTLYGPEMMLSRVEQLMRFYEHLNPTIKIRIAGETEEAC